jgi:hypothetical protein
MGVGLHAQPAFTFIVMVPQTWIRHASPCAWNFLKRPLRHPVVFDLVTSDVEVMRLTRLITAAIGQTGSTMLVAADMPSTQRRPRDS